MSYINIITYLLFIVVLFNANQIIAEQKQFRNDIANIQNNIEKQNVKLNYIEGYIKGKKH